MTDWKDNEVGPKCPCGNLTFVKIIEGEPTLFCLFHTSQSGTSWTLPKDRPSNWPDLNTDELDKLMRVMNNDCKQ